jgi:hypothetical protein
VGMESKIRIGKQKRRQRREEEKVKNMNYMSNCHKISRLSQPDSHCLSVYHQHCLPSIPSIHPANTAHPTFLTYTKLTQSILQTPSTHPPCQPSLPHQVCLP